MKTLVRVSLLIPILVFSVLYFTTVTSLSGSGEKIVELKAELSKLEKQNRSLFIAVDKQYHIAEIDEKAQKAGLVFSPKFVYVKIPSSLAVSKR